jgi:DUF4097 and DUF4098 domain-containing protein YvlB
MNTKILAFLLTLGSLAVTPALAEDINKTVDASADGHVDISNIAGVVEVEGWSRTAVEVTGELGDRVDELIVERDGDRVTIKVKVPRNSSRGISSDLYVKVPERSSLDVGTVSADITVEGVLGELDLGTVSGDVEVEDASDDISAESVSGDVEIEGNGKAFETSAASVSGDVTVLRRSGEVGIETVSGDLVVEEGAFERVSLESVNGEIVFNGSLAKDGRLQAEAVNGDIDLDFVGDLSATIDIETFNGSIDNCFGPEPERTSKYTPGLELSFTEGAGAGRISVATMNGDIRICKE